MGMTLLFDADDTIFDFHKAEHNAICYAQKKYALGKYKNFSIRYSEINDVVWKEYERGEIEYETISETRFVRLFAIYGIDWILPRQIAIVYKEALSEQAVLIKGIRKLLKKLYKENDLYIITNGTTYTQEKRLKKSKLNKYFKNVFISQKIQFRKPQKEFFDYVKSTVAHFDSSQTYIIGDSLTSDIKGGVLSNIPTIWFNQSKKQNNFDFSPSFTVSTPAELDRLLAKLAKREKSN